MLHSHTKTRDLYSSRNQCPLSVGQGHKVKSRSQGHGHVLKVFHQRSSHTKFEVSIFCRSRVKAKFKVCNDKQTDSTKTICPHSVRFNMVQNDGETKGRYSRLLLAHSINSDSGCLISYHLLLMETFLQLSLCFNKATLVSIIKKS